jgi:hypothetical protein
MPGGCLFSSASSLFPSWPLKKNAVTPGVHIFFDAAQDLRIRK